jgi:hypothetical protein
VAPATGLSTRPSLQAYHILYFCFALAPIIAGVDKFTHLMVNWNMYLAPIIAARLPIDTHLFMEIIGGIEVLAGCLVAFHPRLGGMLVALWLWAITANLILAGFYDIAFRDLFLSFGALALVRLAVEYDEKAERTQHTPNYS